MKSKKRINFLATLAVSAAWGLVYFGSLKFTELLYDILPGLPGLPESPWNHPVLSSSVAFVAVLILGRLFLVLKEMAFAKGAGIKAEEEFARPASSLAPEVALPDGVSGWVKIVFGVFTKQADETVLLVGGAGFEMLVGMLVVFAFYAGIDSEYVGTMIEEGLLILSVLMICFGYAARSVNIRGTFFWIPYPLVGFGFALLYLHEAYWEANVLMFFAACVLYLVLCLLLGLVSAFLYGVFTRMAISQDEQPKVQAH